MDAVREKAEEMCSKLRLLGDASINFKNQMKDVKVHFLCQKKNKTKTLLLVLEDNSGP